MLGTVAGSLLSELAAAQPTPAAPAVARAAPSPWRGGISLEFGTLRRPSLCPGYCQDAYGPAVGVSAGRVLLPELAVVVEGWLFERDARAALAGAQWWLAGRGWLRGSAGVMSTSHHNADGGEGAGTGPAISLGAGARLACFGEVSTELSLRATAVVHDTGRVTSLTVGYGLAW
jgi:hypothetical protein